LLPCFKRKYFDDSSAFAAHPTQTVESGNSEKIIREHYYNILTGKGSEGVLEDPTERPPDGLTQQSWIARLG
jgi:hypothetical protein